MIARLVTSSVLGFRTKSLALVSLFRFSAEEQPKIEGTDHQVRELDRASTFYRNSIRRININNKGRGKFTEHHLLRLAKLVDNEAQLPLLFEGYYNYLGHFTVISCSTVDKMMEKILSFEQAPLDSVIQIFSNHNYLGYFPAYKITSKLIDAALKDEQKLGKLIHVLIQSPLIKFDKQIVSKLLQIINSESLSQPIYSSTVKLLIQRSVNELISQFITQQELIKQIVISLQHKLAQKPHHIFTKSESVIQIINIAKENAPWSDQLAYNLAILGYSFGVRPLFFQHLITIKNSAKIAKVLEIVANGPESYQRSVIGYLQDQQLSEELRNGVQALKSKSGESQKSTA